MATTTTSQTDTIATVANAGSQDRKRDRSSDMASTQRTSKRRATIHLLSSMALKDVMHLGTLQKAKMCSIVPITNEHNKSLYMQLNGGGSIPLSFGLSERKDRANSFTVAMSVNDSAEHDALVRLTDDLRETAVTNWKTWFPTGKAPSDVLVRDLCNVAVSEGNTKKGSTDTWPGLTKASFEASDIEVGKCVIKELGTGEKIHYSDLAGMIWHKAIFELKHLYVLGNKSYGVSKKLRYLEVSDGDSTEVVIPL